MDVCAVESGLRALPLTTRGAVMSCCLGAKPAPPRQEGRALGFVRVPSFLVKCPRRRGQLRRPSEGTSSTPVACTEAPTLMMPPSASSCRAFFLVIVLSSVNGVAMLPPLRPVQRSIQINGVAAAPVLRGGHGLYTHPTHDLLKRSTKRWSDLSPKTVTLAGGGTNVLLAGLKASVGISARQPGMHAHNFYSSRPCLWAPLHIKRSPFLFPFPFAVTGSASLIADAGHSLSDLISDGLALAATAVPHWESVCTQGIAVLLCLAGCSMIAQGWGAFVAMRGTIAAGVASASPVLDAVALSVALVSIGAKEALYRVTHAVGLRCGSSTLVANAHHHRSDAMSSVAAAVGLGASIAGLRVMDPLAALVVGGMVLKLGISTAVGEHDH